VVNFGDRQVVNSGDRQAGAAAPLKGQPVSHGAPRDACRAYRPNSPDDPCMFGSRQLLKFGF